MRMFLGIPIPSELKERVWKVSTRLPDDGVKRVEYDNLHITLKFLGEVGERLKDRIIDNIDAILPEVHPFPLELKGIGFFPNERFVRVIWIGVGKGREEMIKLSRMIDTSLSSLGFSPEHDYVPHLTIARVKKKIPLNLNDVIDQSFGEMTVNRIVLYQSRLTPKGPIYSEIKSFELR